MKKDKKLLRMQGRYRNKVLEFRSWVCWLILAGVETISFWVLIRGIRADRWQLKMTTLKLIVNRHLDKPISQNKVPEHPMLDILPEKLMKVVELLIWWTGQTFKKMRIDLDLDLHQELEHQIWIREELLRIGVLYIKARYQFSLKTFS